MSPFKKYFHDHRHWKSGWKYNNNLDCLSDGYNKYVKFCQVLDKKYYKLSVY